MPWRRVTPYLTKPGTRFDQSNYDVGGGVCLSLCLPWIKDKLSTSGVGDATGRIRHMEQEAQGKAKTRQNFQGMLWAQGGGHTNIQAPAQFLGIQRVATLADTEPIHAATIAAMFKANVGRAFLMDYQWRSHTPDRTADPDGEVTGAHAVAWYYSHGRFGVGFFGGYHLYLFDPNCGEFRVDGGRAEEFVQDYFADVADAFNEAPETYILESYKAVETAGQKIGEQAIKGLKKNAHV